MAESATQNASNTEAQQQSVTDFLLEVSRIAFRAPPRVPDEPEMWFSQLEHSFASGEISSEASKFSYLCSSLDPRYSVVIKDLIITPPTETPYTTTKEELLKRLNVSQDAKTRRLLEDQVLGDRKPSEFLRHLRGLGGTGVSESLLRTLWLCRLPTNVQLILATQQDTPLDKTAQLADSIVETIRGAPAVHQPQIAAETPQPNLLLEALTTQIAQFTTVFIY